jgi:hypothetical protein
VGPVLWRKLALALALYLSIVALTTLQGMVEPGRDVPVRAHIPVAAR